ncbi:MAG: hypothetical protein ABIH41_05600, partial [Nanoarchaeota archaeon]
RFLARGKRLLGRESVVHFKSSDKEVIMFHVFFFSSEKGKGKLYVASTNGVSRSGYHFTVKGDGDTMVPDSQPECVERIVFNRNYQFIGVVTIPVAQAGIESFTADGITRAALSLLNEWLKSHPFQGD